MVTGSGPSNLCLTSLILTSFAVMFASSNVVSPSGQHRSTNCRNSSGSRVACRHNETDADISNVASAPAVVMETNDVTSDLIADNSTSQNGNRRRDNATRPKYRLIRGSKQAATITRKELLKTDWCQTEPFQQIIHEEGCLKSRILNRFCYGQCNSFFIPKSEVPEVTFGNLDRVDAYAASDYVVGHFRSCAVCTPKVTEWAVVVLRCPRLTPPFRRKRIRIVRQCKCMALKLD